jgi:hypothetical protein
MSASNEVVNSLFVWEGLLLPDQRQGVGVWADHVIQEKLKQRHLEMKSFGDQEKTDLRSVLCLRMCVDQRV